LRNAPLPQPTPVNSSFSFSGFQAITSEEKLLLESKEDMRRRGVPTPDEADAVALCFTEPGGSPVPRSIALNFNRRIEYPNLGNA
jgi:hypothetical protein